MSVTGRVFISLAGQRIRSKEGASLDVGGLEKEPAMSDSGVDGSTSKLTPPKVECKINHTDKTKIKDLQAFEGTLTFETDTGRVYTLVDAFCTKPPKLEKGEVSLEFSAVECLED
jgi:hypothetical protein